MKPGDITRAVRTPRGFQILKLETLEAADAAAVRERPRSDRRQGRTTRGSRSRCASSCAGCAAQAIIEWKNDELKKAYESRPRRSAQTRLR